MREVSETITSLVIVSNNMLCVWCKKATAKYGSPKLCYKCYKKRAKIKQASILSEHSNFYASKLKEKTQ
jgi:hypothetical protein